jgi:hypothetical protein
LSKKLNHSRHLDYYATDVGNRVYAKAKSTPTAKQVKFYKKLYAMCKEHGIDTNTGIYTRTRADYAWNIDKLIGRLQEQGVDVKGNSKKAVWVLEHKSDRRGNYYTKESIEIRDDPQEHPTRRAIKVSSEIVQGLRNDD